MDIQKRTEQTLERVKGIMNEFVEKEADQLIDSIIQAHREQIRMIEEYRKQAKEKGGDFESMFHAVDMAKTIAEHGWDGKNMSIKRTVASAEHEIIKQMRCRERMDFLKFILEG